MKKLINPLTLFIATFAIVLCANIAALTGLHAQTVQSPRIGSLNSAMPCQYNASAPSLSGGNSGQVLFEQCDPSGNVMTRTAAASGATQLLATSVSASANQVWTSASLGAPKHLTLCLASSAATTFTVSASIDGANYEQEQIASALTSANYAPSGAGSECEAIAPLPFIKVATSAAVTVTAHLAAAY